MKYALIYEDAEFGGLNYRNDLDTVEEARKLGDNLAAAYVIVERPADGYWEAL